VEQEWRYTALFRREDRVRIESLGVELALEDIYRGVEAADAIMPLEFDEEGSIA